MLVKVVDGMISNFKQAENWLQDMWNNADLDIVDINWKAVEQCLKAIEKVKEFENSDYARELSIYKRALDLMAHSVRKGTYYNVCEIKEMYLEKARHIVQGNERKYENYIHN